MDIYEFKQQLISTGLFKKVSGDGQYKCQTCPYCGDTKYHMYVKIKPGSDDPVLYKCFKCNSSGLLKQDWLDYFGIEMKVPPIKGRKRIRPNSSVDLNEPILDPVKDRGMIEMCREYFMKRLGVEPTMDELKAFQLIGNPFDYVKSYLGGDMWGLKDRLWFRMNNGCIAGRAVDDNVSLRWRKRSPAGMSAGLYSIKFPVDTCKPIIICICEGVLDAIGLYYHVSIPNAVYVACMGSDYAAGMRYAIDMGVFGDSVSVHIYKDADVNRVSVPMSYKRLFKSVNVYHNNLAKDYGVKRELIEIEKSF